LTDAAGNGGTPATATATLDTTAPDGYTIAVNQDPINAGSATAVSFTFDNAEEFTTYNYTVTSSGGAGSVAGTGTVVLSIQTIMGIDVSSLSPGLLTFSVTLTDAAGNAGSPVEDTATLE
jgi:hypothetical protein